MAQIFGTDANDTLFGTASNDTIIGGLADTGMTNFTFRLEGGTGDDYYNGGNFGVSVIDNQGNNLAALGGGDDSFLGTGTAYGESGNDSLLGNGHFYGGDGNDSIFLFSSRFAPTVTGGVENYLNPLSYAYAEGGAGNDTLRADMNVNAFLRGGSGNDTFVLSLNEAGGPLAGQVTNIYDFNLTQDRLDIDFRANGVSLQDRSAVNSFQVVNYEGGVFTDLATNFGTIRLVGVQLNSLDQINWA